jgi:hypothetical protein
LGGGRNGRLFFGSLIKYIIFAGMKSNELRIGNIVLDDYSGTIKVVNINSEYNCIDYKKPNFKAVGRMEIQYIKPIPLTEEWLLKFGFEIKKGGWSAATHKINTELTINNAHKVWRFTPIWCLDYASIQYVHQLQNLYFALTNQELTINKL